MIALCLAALATPDFDPAAPDAVFTGAEVFSHDGAVPLWGRIDRYSDPDRTLFQQEEFSALFQWRDTTYTPFMGTLWGTTQPHSSSFLLHYGLTEEGSSGTPVLFVHGAGDNASRGAFAIRAAVEAEGRPFYAITFAHPHGEMHQQAETVANAIAVIRNRTGADQVDLVGHSKGGLAMAAYASNAEGTGWASSAYTEVGTDYRGDVRRMVFVGTPLDGIDTAYRWSASNFFSFDIDLAPAPVSWSAYYPFGTTAWWYSEDLEGQDFFADGGDPFPGQRQLLKRQDHPLPGSLPWLGGYALQTDWWTTYEGGYGLYSHSYGIDAAIEAGDYFVDTLAEKGIDPGIEIFVLAGTNPMMPSGDEAFEAVWDGLATPSQWELLLSSISTFVTPIDATDAEVRGLSDGKLVLGEVSGPSDGVLFLDSATATQSLTARGAIVVETRVVDISHTELMIASETFGATFQLLAGDDPENAWMIDRGDRYIAASTPRWIVEKLADPTSGTQGRGGGEDATQETGRDGVTRIGCDAVGSSAVFGLLPLLALGLARRR